MSDKAKQLLETANRNCERLTLLINDILDLEKIESGMLALNMIAMDLAAVVQQSLVSNEGYAQKHAVKLRIIETVTVANIIGDELRISQVLANLLSNAIKYSSENGVVEIVIAQDSGQVKVSIKDHGTGIPEGFRHRLFQRFAQADGSDTKAKGGTGLGLSICKAIVERHGGTIGYHSQEGVGTEFYFQLPLVQDHKAIESLNSHRSSVLICEDDMATATILAHMLESEGIASDIALTANSAKQLLTINHYQTLLLDLTLPDLDGLQLISELRDDKVLQHLPIIVVSGRADEGQQIMDGRADNVVDWLQKPIVQERLVGVLKQTSHRKNRHHLLHIEDDRDLTQITRTLVEGIADYTCALTLEDARLLLAKEQFDIILLDLHLPDGSGLELMNMIRQLSAQVIVFSGHELSSIDRDGITTVLTKAKTSNDQLLKAIKNIID
jgi:DNA-binding response OmpR family regulator